MADPKATTAPSVRKHSLRTDQQTTTPTSLNDAILAAALREAEAFFDFPAGEVYTPDQRAQIVALSHKIACRRGWAPRDLITGQPRDTAALLARANVALAAAEEVLANVRC